jgi:hypothetical protein
VCCSTLSPTVPDLSTNFPGYDTEPRPQVKGSPSYNLTVKSSIALRLPLSSALPLIGGACPELSYKSLCA